MRILANYWENLPKIPAAELSECLREKKNNQENQGDKHEKVNSKNRHSKKQTLENNERSRGRGEQKIREKNSWKRGRIQKQGRGQKEGEREEKKREDKKTK